MTIFRRIALATLAATAAPALAQPFEDLDALQGQVVASLGAEVGEPGGPARPLDARLKLSPCPEPAVVDAPAMGAVAVRCQSLGWRIRVPLFRHPGASSASAAGAVKAVPVVRRGDQVELRAGGATFNVTMTAIAEEDGAEGARIRVRSDRKAQVMIAEVESPGRVFLPGFK